MRGEVNDGGSAFPLPPGSKDDGRMGMTLRDWFAGQALTGILTRPEAYGEFALCNFPA